MSMYRLSFDETLDAGLEPQDLDLECRCVACHPPFEIAIYRGETLVRTLERDAIQTHILVRRLEHLGATTECFEDRGVVITL